MISALTYGRNDNYGLNPHKRAALSLNCLAEVLDEPDDEILFVDYNTQDALPSLPEAIADTLTPRARAMLRVLRVRPHIHRRYAARTHLGVIEPVARNAALRRSNPANRWILSTNTDMIFAPEAAGGLSTIAAGLADGYYHLPRFELPQSLWEALDRRDPRAAIVQAVAWSRALALSEIVRNDREYIIYDGPGDFQLMLREDLLRIHGFDERILLGWHVDSNIAKRLFLLRGPSGDLAAALRGYHCEHTRGATPKHLAERPENDFSAVVEAVARPVIEEQEASFGLAGDDLEEIRLRAGAASFLQALLPEPGGEEAAPPPSLHVGIDAFDQIDYDARHVLPFLMDVLASEPHDLTLGWFGTKRSLLERAASAWRALGFTRPIWLAGPAPWLVPAPPEGAVWHAAEEVISAAAACVFDFGRPDGSLPDVPRRQTLPEHAFVLRGLRALAASEAGDCRVIAVNAINNRFASALATHAVTTLSPVTTRIRQGSIRPRDEGRRALLPLMWTGEAGRRPTVGKIVETRDDVAGIICGGPKFDLLPGRYRVAFEMGQATGTPGPGALTFMVCAGDILLAQRIVGRQGGQRVALEFGVTGELADALLPLGMEAILRTDGQARASLRSVWLERLAGPPELPAEHEWLPAMSVRCGAWASRGWPWPRRVVRAATGEPGHVVFGPFVGLVPGNYEVAFTLDAESAAGNGSAPILLDIRAGGRCLASRPVTPAAKGQRVWRLPVTVDAALADADGRMGLEFRVWTDGALSFAVLSVRTRRLVGSATRGDSG